MSEKWILLYVPNKVQTIERPSEINHQGLSFFFFRYFCYSTNFFILLMPKSE